jgi:hypothetical protein
MKNTFRRAFGLLCYASPIQLVHSRRASSRCAGLLSSLGAESDVNVVSLLIGKKRKSRSTYLLPPFTFLRLCQRAYRIRPPTLGDLLELSAAIMLKQTITHIAALK